MSILCRFRVIARFSSKVTNFNPHTCICRPRRGWSLSNFAMIFGVRKLKSRAIVRRYLRDPTFSRFDTIPECDRHTHTDRQTDRHTTTAYTVLSKASRGKNSSAILSHPVCHDVFRFFHNIVLHDIGMTVWKLDLSILTLVRQGRVAPSILK